MDIPNFVLEEDEAQKGEQENCVQLICCFSTFSETSRRDDVKLPILLSNKFNECHGFDEDKNRVTVNYAFCF